MKELPNIRGIPINPADIEYPDELDKFPTLPAIVKELIRRNIENRKMNLRRIVSTQPEQEQPLSGYSRNQLFSWTVIGRIVDAKSTLE